MANGMPAIRPGITNANGDGGSSAGVVGPLTRPAPPPSVVGLALPPSLVPGAGAEAESVVAARGSDDDAEGDVDDPGDPTGGVTVVPFGAGEGVGPSGSVGTGSDGTGSEGTGSDGTGRLGCGRLGVGSDGNGMDGNGIEGNGIEGSGGDGTGKPIDGTGTDGSGRDGSGSDGSGTGRVPAAARSTRSMSRRQPTPIAPIAP